jgi:type VI secretion system protein ImpF
MAAIRSSSELLRSSLLDRLTDDRPNEGRDYVGDRGYSHRQLKEAVLRDMQWLLNAISLDSAVPLDEYPEVAKSVLNYGIPDLSAVRARADDVTDLGKRIERAIRSFEPRIIPNTLSVGAAQSDQDFDSRLLCFEVEGDLWADPAPMHLLIRTEIDLESGSAALVTDRGN